MAIKVNGLLVAGLGKSAYEQAQEGGYTGTEEEFISALANIGSNPTAEGLPVNDVRTGTVRDGQSIAAGDVVNVRSLGKTVAIQWNGKPTPFRVVQVGNPDPSIYDASCDGIWVMAVDRSINMVFGSNNDYKSSNVHTWCNGDFINGFEPEMREKIKTVKIPYWDGTGTEGSLKNGAEGLSTKGFILSLEEFNHTLDGVRSIGDALSAFTVDVPQTLSTYFVCRNPSASNNTQVASLHTGNQTPQIIYSATQTLAITPCFILPLDTDLSTIGTVVEDNYDVYRDVVAQKNVENVFEARAIDGSDIVKLNDSYSVCAYIYGAGNALYVRLIENSSGEAVGGSVIVSSGSTSYASVSLARLDDSHFVVAHQANNSSYWWVYQVTGTTITLADGSRGLGGNSTNPVVVTLSTSNFAVAHNSNGRLRLTVGSYPFASTANELNSVNPAHISATRIPDDNSGNKRVCICFSDTGDGNKGKAVIATIDSANAVTFGDVVTFSDGTVYATSCAADKTGNILVGYIEEIPSTTNKKSVFVILNTELEAVSNKLSNHEGSIGFIQAVVYNENKFLGVVNNHVDLLGFSGEELTLLKSYSYNRNTPGCLSVAAIEKSKILIAFANRSNSSYGTTTILEVSGNQIAGSFRNNSKDAIALESGEGGDTIKLGFGGYCACEDMTAGQTIDSEGITAYSPLDGWLETKDPWARGYVTGEYTGDGTYGADNPTVIDVGFRPECLIIGAESANSATGAVFVLLNGVNLSYSLPNGEAVNVSVNESQILFYGNSASGQMNASGSVYRYIAWR